MYERKLISYPAEMRVTSLVIDSIRFIRSLFPANSSFCYMYFADTPYNCTNSKHVQTAGVMVNKDYIQTSGWASVDDTKVIPYGPFTLTALEDAIRWCCVGIADNEPTEYISVVRMVAGDALHLQQNDNVLILSGSITTPAGLLMEGKHVKASRNVAVTCFDPSILFKWNTADVEATYSLSPLAKAKQEKWNIIKGIRTIKTNGGLLFNGALYDSDSEAQSNISKAAQLALIDPTFEIDWTTANNSLVRLNATDMIMLGKALGMHIKSIRDAANEKRAAIYAASSMAELNDINWSV